jgi:hypothetical protein
MDLHRCIEVAGPDGLSEKVPGGLDLHLRSKLILGSGQSQQSRESLMEIDHRQRDMTTLRANGEQSATTTSSPRRLTNLPPS